MLEMKQTLSKLRHPMRLFKSSKPDPARSATAANAGASQTMAVPRSSVSVPVPEGSQAELVCDSPQLKASLENLPPEIRRQLLSILSLEDLSALVHASPVFHQQYLLDRRSLLCKYLETTLGSVTIDAYTVYQSGLTDSSDTRTREKVTQFLEWYQYRRSSTRYSTLTKRLAEDEAVGMVAFHSSIIKPLARHYTGWALANLANESEGSQSHELLSRTEETRLMRALYRFQLCCNLFGNGHHDTSWPWQLRLGFQPVDILKIFICIFEPWEVEEIACIYTFAKEKYDQIFRDIRWDVHEANPKFEGQRPPTPEGAFDLDNSWVRKSLLKGTISRGLELLHTILFKIRDHAHLVSTMQEQISWPAGYFLEDEALDDAAQSQRRKERLSDRDQKQQRRDPLPFQGDGEADANGPRPPLAWTLMWRGTYSNLYGYYVPDVIRRWGYAMWDAARLECTGAKEVLARQWEAVWGDSDPRDDF